MDELTKKVKVEVLAEKLYVGALASARNLGDVTYGERKQLFKMIREMCFNAAEVFYRVDE